MVGKDQDVQVFRLGNWMRMVLTGEEKSGMGIELGGSTEFNLGHVYGL